MTSESRARFRRRIAVLGFACLPLLAACGSSGPSSTAGKAPSGSSSSAVSQPATTSSPTATCPTGVAVSAAIGSTVPAPQEFPGIPTGIMCTYMNLSNDRSVVLTIMPTKATSASEFINVFALDASRLNASPVVVSGLGDAAEYYRTPSSVGAETTNLAVLTGSTDVGVVAGISPAQAEAVARVVLRLL
jgi:hypothetical protein